LLRQDGVGGQIEQTHGGNPNGTQNRTESWAVPDNYGVAANGSNTDPRPAVWSSSDIVRVFELTGQPSHCAGMRKNHPLLVSGPGTQRWE
jgi:hypothetical protein